MFAHDVTLQPNARELMDLLQTPPLANLPVAQWLSFADIHGKTLLYYAIARNDFTAVTALVTAGALIEAQKLLKDLKLDYVKQALQQDHLDIAKYLADQGADTSNLHLQDAHTTEGKAWLTTKIAALINKTRSWGNEYNLTKNASYSTQFFSLRSAQDIAIYAAEIGHIEFIQTLMRTTWWQHQRNFCNELLQAAAANGQLKILAILLAKENALEPAQPYTDGALASAIKNQQLATVHYLLAEGADINRQNKDKYTALMLAVENGQQDMMTILLAAQPDLTLIDTEDNTVIHLAVSSGNRDILAQLLQIEQCQPLLNQQNIYGHTPITLAIQANRPDLIALLDPNYTTPSAIPEQPICIAQEKIIDPMAYYLRLQNQTQDFLDLNGHCAGFTFLFLYYHAQGKTVYFYQTLAMISAWDGKRASLTAPLLSSLPQSQYYHNLKGLMEQWTNDIIWFQHSGNNQNDLSKFTGIASRDHEQLYAITANNGAYKPCQLCHFNNTYTRAQLIEIIELWKKMHSATKIIVYASGHATAIYCDETQSMCHYDSNDRYPTIRLMSTHALLNRLINSHFIRTSTYPTSSDAFTFEFKLFYFAKDAEKFTDYKIFSDAELPTSAAMAATFQARSPNQFTHLHIAIIGHSINSLQQLVQTGHCDINATNIHGETPLALAIAANFTLGIDILLQADTINLNNSLEAVQAYKKNNRELLDKIITHKNATNLVNLLTESICKNDLDLFARLLKEGKVLPNSLIDGQTLISFIINYRKLTSFIDILIQHGAKANQDDLKTALARLRSIPKSLYQAFLEYDLLPDVITFLLYNKDFAFFDFLLAKTPCERLNQLDANGFAPLHTATLHYRYEVVEKLLKANADVNVQDQKQQTCLHIIIKNLTYEEKWLNLFAQYHPCLDLLDHLGKTALEYASEDEQAELKVKFGLANAKPLSFGL